jgi:proline racemase
MLKELKTYKLIIGDSATGETGRFYQVVNKDTNVVEVETRILPQALDYVVQLQDAIDKHMNPSKEESNVKQAAAIVKPYNH